MDWCVAKFLQVRHIVKKVENHYFTHLESQLWIGGTQKQSRHYCVWENIFEKIFFFFFNILGEKKLKMRDRSYCH